MKNVRLRIIIIISVFTGFAGFSCTTVPGNETNTHFQTYRISDNECAIVAYLGNSANLVIPDTINKRAVAEISEGVFQGKNLASVIIPNSVKNIGKDAFKNNRLTSVVISGNVTVIGQDAFSNNYLTGVTIPDSVKQIGDSAFRNNRLASVTIGNNVENIGSRAFSDNQLAGVTIPGSVRIIDDNAFAGNPLAGVTVNSKSNAQELKVLLRNDVSVIIPGGIILITSNSLGGFSKAYAANNRQPGTYTKQGDNFLFNGTLLPEPAVITAGGNAWLTKINGQSPVLYCFDFSRDRSVSNWQNRGSMEALALKKFPFPASITNFYQGTFYLPPGQHSIELIYFTGQTFSTIIRTLEQNFDAGNTYRVSAELSSTRRRVIYEIKQTN